MELENIFEESPSTAGVLITGEPGSGKSALMSQLICSPFSSLFIHENTIGYHLCEYSEKGKRDGARFVRNLVNQISVKLPKYSEHVKNNERLRVELDTRCHKDPTSCFFTAIVGPLRKLEQPNTLRFIIIDALDECFESDSMTSEILNILKGKILAFPKWLKIIFTSRNLTSVTSRIPQVVKRMPLYAADERNVNDVRFYVSRFMSQNSHFMDKLLIAMDYSSRTKGIKIFMDEIIARAEGNFLFVKTTLQYMNDTGGTVDFYSLPTNLYDLYNIFFDRQFSTAGFAPFRFLFEVLLAAYSPLQSQHVEEILKSEYEADDYIKLTEQVSCFLRFGQDGTIRIYHQSFAEWLTNQSLFLSINKTRGHRHIARFLMRHMRERHADVTFGELTELFIHILSGGELNTQKNAINLFNITEKREANTNQSILHYLATKPIIYLPVFDFFLQKLKMVDVLDANNKTPAFYAASEGNVRHLQSCIKNGANISSFLEGYSELDPVSVIVTNTGIEKFSVMHVAAAKGHKEIVQLLLQSSMSILDFGRRYPTPLHLAASNGHLEVVRLFYDYNETFDLITLHHAAARNHFSVVSFLLSTVGLRDSCVPCQPEHFSTISKNMSPKKTHAFLCETALHAAVSRGLIDIVELLLNFGKASLECKHHSGKTVLVDAVEKNNSEMVDLLTKYGVNITADCGRKMSKDSVNQICSVYATRKKDFLYTVYCVNDSCRCGYTAIHISAKYGLWNIAEKLLSGRTKDVLDIKDCSNNSAALVAIIYDHTDFVNNINMSLNKIGHYLVGSKVVKLATAYCSADVANGSLDHIIHNDENMWNVLLELVKWSPCRELTIIHYSHCLDAFRDSYLCEAETKEKESKRRLNGIKLLVETEKKSSILDRKDHKNRTLLHYAAANGFVWAVKYLVELGADVRLNDENRDTPLMIALKYSPVNDQNSSASYTCYTTNDGQFSSCKTTCYDETVSYLIQAQKANISKCDNESELILMKITRERMPLSLYALLKIGVDWNCRLNFLTSPMLIHLHVGGEEVTEVIKIFEVDVSVKCGISFSESELHRLVYFNPAPGEFGNFFEPSLNNKRLLLQVLIDRHPRGVRVLDECFDAEGYLPIHRAAQGGNLAAIKWLKNVGANIQLKTRTGFTALDLSVWYVTHHSMDTYGHGNKLFEEVLRAFFDISHTNYSSDYCTTSFARHPILHTAASIGLHAVASVYNQALNIIPNLRKRKYMLLDEQDADGNTPLHFAATKGHEHVVKYLVGLGADINIKNKNNHTPIWFALLSAPVHSVKTDAAHGCYTTDDGLFKTCETTPHDEIVRYLMSRQKSESISKCDDESAFFLNTVVEKRMPLTLYVLLKIGVDVNCQSDIWISPFLEHLRRGGKEISEVFKMFEVNISVRCWILFTVSELHLISYKSVTDDFGNFFKPSLNKKRSPMQTLIDRHPRGVRILDECYDAEGYLPIHRAAQGGNLVAIKWFKNVGVNMQLKTRTGLTALDLSILYLGDVRFDDEYNNRIRLNSKLNAFVQRNTLSRRKCYKELLRVYFSTRTSNENYSSDYFNVSSLNHRILHTAAKNGFEVVKYVYKIALKIIPGLKKNKHLLLNDQDEDGDTPLHVAAYHGHERAVKYLVGLGADVNIMNNDNHTPLFSALLSEVHVLHIKLYLDHRCYTTDDGLFKTCETTPHDEIVRYLISMQKSQSISTCDAKSVILLNTAIEQRMPLSLYALLKIGVDINCQQSEWSSPFMKHIRKRGRGVSEVLKMFKLNVSVQCGVSFKFSELHLISYTSVSKEFGNFFNFSLNKDPSPMQRMIDTHPRGVGILDECYDAEGYLPIHRAAQGGNLVAIKWFKSVGVDTQLKTQTGLTALDISILYLGNISYGEFSASPNIYMHLHHSYWFPPVINSKYRSKVFEELLQTFFRTPSKSKLPCGALEGLSPLHIAAVKGVEVLKYVHKKASKTFPNLRINCVNEHHLDPVYLAQFYDSVRNEGLIDQYSGENSPEYLNFEDLLIRNNEKDFRDMSLDELIELAKEEDENSIELEFGDVPAPQYPNCVVDYIMAFNYLYNPPDIEYMLFSDGEDVPRVSDCPSYYDNFPKYTDVKSLPELLDTSECHEIRVRHDFYWSLCMREIDEIRKIHQQVEKCNYILSTLQSWYTNRRRRNRQLSHFILKRLGWSEGSRKKDIDKQWPFYIIHNLHVKEYKSYKYLKVLNEALEVSDIRFHSRRYFW